jgi:hypothetical protein
LQKSKDADLLKIKMRTHTENIQQELKRNEMLNTRTFNKKSIKKLSQIPDSPIKQTQSAQLRRTTFRTRASSIKLLAHSRVLSIKLWFSVAGRRPEQQFSP